MYLSINRYKNYLPPISSSSVTFLLPPFWLLLFEKKVEVYFVLDFPGPLVSFVPLTSGFSRPPPGDIYVHITPSSAKHTRHRRLPSYSSLVNRRCVPKPDMFANWCFSKKQKKKNPVALKLRIGEYLLFFFFFLCMYIFGVNILKGIYNVFVLEDDFNFLSK